MITDFSESTLYLVSAGDIPIDVFSDRDQAWLAATASPVRKLETLHTVSDIQKGKHRIIARANYLAESASCHKLPSSLQSLLSMVWAIDRFIESW